MRGTIVIAIDPRGRVAETATDFDGPTAGGFSKSSEQERRAKEQLWASIVRNYCSEFMWKTVKETRAFDGLSRLARDGWRFETRTIDTEIGIVDDED